MGQYLSSVVHGSVNGALTTVALTSLMSGANLPLPAIVAVGLSGLLAGSIIVALSTYLTIETENDNHKMDRSAVGSAFIDLIFYIIMGLIPMMSFLVCFYYQIRTPWMFPIAYGLSALVLFLSGLIKGLVLGHDRFYHGLQTLGIGGLASLMAYFVGSLTQILAGVLGYKGYLGLCTTAPVMSPSSVPSASTISLPSIKLPTGLGKTSKIQ